MTAFQDMTENKMWKEQVISLGKGASAEPSVRMWSWVIAAVTRLTKAAVVMKLKSRVMTLKYRSASF